MSAKLIKNYSEFSEVLSIIRTGRTKADKAVNVALIDTYWAVGEHLSRKVAEAGWGNGFVKKLAGWLLARSPDLKGFSASNLWRMKQFYETYADSPNLAPLVRGLPWTASIALPSVVRENVLSTHAMGRRSAHTRYFRCSPTGCSSPRL